MENKTKTMCITAECGTKRKSVSFPVPADLSDWMNDLSRLQADHESADVFTVEGSRGVTLRISILNYGRKF
jgi:hypothetical protein